LTAPDLPFRSRHLEIAHQFEPFILVALKALEKKDYGADGDAREGELEDFQKHLGEGDLVFVYDHLEGLQDREGTDSRAA